MFAHGVRRRLDMRRNQMTGRCFDGKPRPLRAAAGLADVFFLLVPGRNQFPQPGGRPDPARVADFFNVPMDMSIKID
ncbi:hypothetical protein GCM10019059_20620 [Camelimonas fluminis]|uniref:Uncharacterized protein n=1 Tax=Camelimonas fluminis TaxID=1576911 RepID=A0ABV7UL13_9HYPH|nr:hypothetical protein [Camelimonas fluminis]GHE60963.1 hypothetical protein GCM10019059_20620 [Camelimonas fluminis]